MSIDSPKQKLINPVVSIIVPIYNAQMFLSRCIDSLVAQTYSSLEVLLIDDGSSDDSFSICERYAAKYDNVRLIRQKNLGVSTARNHGIHESAGDFITFVDSDDWLEIDAVENMVKLMVVHNVDCARTNFNKIKAGKSSVNINNTAAGRYVTKSQKESILLSAAKGDLLCYTWLLIIRKSVLLKERLVFKEGVSMMEDSWFYFDMLRRVKSIYISNLITYNYVEHKASATRSVEGFKDKVLSVLEVNEYFHSENAFSGKDLAVIDAVHLSIIASLLMVRADNARSLVVVDSMLNTIANEHRVARIYKTADFSSLSIYHKVASAAVAKNRMLVVCIIMAVRKLSGK